MTYAVEQLPATIAFGSCGKATRPQPILEDVAALAPDLFIYLGDNVYGDSSITKAKFQLDPELTNLKAKYDLLKVKPEFIALKAVSTLLSTWDDHDYGQDDAGKHFAYKEKSKQLFMEFWEEPAESPRFGRAGIYTSRLYQNSTQALQVILLDTRTFRDDLVRKRRYIEHADPDATLLGAAQWQWLEAQLQIPADIRIIASSIQFGHQHNGDESWRNLPLEHQKMLDLIKTTRANGVMFISGDVHWGEISKVDEAGLYPIYDVTSSGINVTWGSVSPNSNRVGSATDKKHHYGVFHFDWSNPKVGIAASIVDIDQMQVTSFATTAAAMYVPIEPMENPRTDLSVSADVVSHR